MPVSAFQALTDTARPSLPPFLHSTTAHPLSLVLILAALLLLLLNECNYLAVEGHPRWRTIKKLFVGGGVGLSFPL